MTKPITKMNACDITFKGKEALEKGNLDKAIAYYELACELEPESITALTGKINCLLEKGDIDEAVKTTKNIKYHDDPLAPTLIKTLFALYNKTLKLDKLTSTSTNVDADDIQKLNTLWDTYYEALEEVYGDVYKSSEIQTNGFKTGCLPTKLSEPLLKEIDAAESDPWSADSYRDGFAHTPDAVQYEGAINKALDHLKIHPALLECLNKTTHELAPTVSEAIGTAWRVLNVRIWKTFPHKEGEDLLGSLAWHHDGMPDGMLKLLIYMSDISADTGTVEWKDADDNSSILTGPVGTWLLFQNSGVLHRGVPPKDKNALRKVVEITLTPSILNDQTVIIGGNNARHPWKFWQTDLS